MTVIKIYLIFPCSHAVSLYLLKPTVPPSVILVSLLEHFSFPRAAPSSDREKTEAQGEAHSVCHQDGLTEIWGQSWLGTQTRWFWDQNSISIFFCCWSSQWWTRCLHLMLQENKGFLITKPCYKKTSHSSNPSCTLGAAWVHAKSFILPSLCLSGNGVDAHLGVIETFAFVNWLTKNFASHTSPVLSNRNVKQAI